MKCKKHNEKFIKFRLYDIVANRPLEETYYGCESCKAEEWDSYLKVRYDET